MEKMNKIFLPIFSCRFVDFDRYLNYTKLKEGCDFYED